MNIMNVSHLLNGQDNTLAKNTALHKKDKQLFSEVLNKENKDSVLKKQNTSGRAVNNEYTTKLHSKKTEQREVDENLDTKESKESLANDLSDNIISLLQGLLTTIPTDSLEVENDSKINIELSSLEIEELTYLKDQLSLLVDVMNVETDQSIKESIKAALSMLTKIADETLFTNGNTILVEKGSISEILSNIEGLKDNIDFALKNINSTENGSLQNLSIKKENDLVDAEEENISKDDTTLTNAINTNNEDNTKINNLDKSLLSDNNENPNFLKQNAGQEYIIVNDNMLASQQEKIDHTINVEVLKNEIIEPKQFINEISQKASAFLSKDKNEMSIQLTPENLGKISIKIGLNEGTLTGKIYAENYSVKQIIEANLNQLRDALEESGLNIAGLEVNVGDNSQNFGNGLFKQRIAKTQNTKKVSMEINSGFITLEHEINQRNPYLVSGQFDGLV